MVKDRVATNNFETTKHGWTKEACLRTIEHIEAECEQIKERPLTKYPAYFSVAIHMNEKPSGDVLDELKERAYTFAKENNFTITGFRIASSKTIIEIEDI